MNTLDELIATCLDHFRNGRHAQADTLAQQGLEAFPGHSLLWQLHGTARWHLGDYPAARSALETAELFGPLQPLARCALAGCYARAGERGRARERYAELLADDRCPTALLPRVASELGRIQEDWLALQACRKLARREPTHHAAFFGMAYSMARLDYPPESFLPRLLRAHQLAPDMLPYRVNVAFVMAELGQLDRAHALVRDVSAESVSCACWLRRLMHICEAVGDEVQLRAYQHRLRDMQRY